MTVKKENEKIFSLPILPMKNTALLPYLVMPLSVGRPRSVAAVEAALTSEDKEIVLLSQRDASTENPTQGDLYTFGTKAVIRKISRTSEGHMEVLVLGIERVMLLKIEEDEPFLMGRVQPAPMPEEYGAEVEALRRSVVEIAGKAIELAQVQVPFEVQTLAADNTEPMRVVFLLASLFSLDLQKEQTLLEAQSVSDAYRLLHNYLSHELQVLEIRSKISNQAREEMTKEQREYMLRQQLRAIQQELGEKNPEQAEVDQLRERLEKADLPDEVRKEAERELKRLERLPSASPDHHVVRTWLEFVLELPWRTKTDDNLDVANAREVLDTDHFDLKEVKARILEHLGVLKMNPTAKAPILCLVGPPGVGKTSLGQSIARSLGRKFERFSLGGLHDEAELRGHRRTYIGAMPGRLIQAMRRAGANNPVIMLDEVDKLGRDYRGDPASALLEVLDPEQNNTFRDNYIDMPFDLSKVMFVTTANTLDTIPRPLLDRMEVLRLPGYTEEEKIEIAKRYLIPRQLKETGLTAEQCVITPEALQEIIRRYTREAGLRRLERQIAKVARKAALHFAEGKQEPFEVRPDRLIDLLGPEPFMPEEARKSVPPGVATGLAWTEVGGDVLYIETALLPETKGFTLTGQLGEVMQESAKAAQSYIWSHARELGIEPAKFKDFGVHVHVPAGATPKDGPSAGITMTVALTSLYTRCPARPDIAMTGEVTLTGLVLPIGGVKEKVLAARRSGIKHVIMPKANAKDLYDLPDEARNEMQFTFVEHVSQVLEIAIPGLAARQCNGEERNRAETVEEVLT
ncbi:MAG: endopeptidase La [Bryobacterales bacterium]|nr:endopeptidase La [Bryobacterales bacterium]